MLRLIPWRSVRVGTEARTGSLLRAVDGTTRPASIAGDTLALTSTDWLWADGHGGLAAVGDEPVTLVHDPEI